MSPRKLLALLLSNETLALPALSAADPDQLLDAAAAEGVTAQIHRILTQLAVDRRLLETFRGAAVSQAGAALMLRHERGRVLSAVASWTPVLLKGEVLALTVYPEYPDRPMGDMDLLIRVGDLAAIDSQLHELGYRKQIANRGSLIMPQQSYQLALSGSVLSVIDVHTALFNRPALRHLLDYQQLSEGGVHIAPLPSGVIIPSWAHQVIHAALHLLGHHAGEQRLIWLLDIHLLLEKPEGSGPEELLHFCHEHQLSATLAGVLESVEIAFPSQSPALKLRLQAQAMSESGDGPDLTKLAHDSPIAQALADWKALANTGNRFSWLRQHLFPRPEYMKSHYSLRKTWTLPFFYLWRILRGAVKLLRPK